MLTVHSKMYIFWSSYLNCVAVSRVCISLKGFSFNIKINICFVLLIQPEIMKLTNTFAHVNHNNKSYEQLLK